MSKIAIYSSKEIDALDDFKESKETYNSTVTESVNTINDNDSSYRQLCLEAATKINCAIQELKLIGPYETIYSDERLNRFFKITNNKDISSFYYGSEDTETIIGDDIAGCYDPFIEYGCYKEKIKNEKESSKKLFSNRMKPAIIWNGTTTDTKGYEIYEKDIETKKSEKLPYTNYYDPQINPPEESDDDDSDTNDDWGELKPLVEDMDKPYTFDYSLMDNIFSAEQEIKLKYNGYHSNKAIKECYKDSTLLNTYTYTENYSSDEKKFTMSVDNIPLVLLICDYPSVFGIDTTLDFGFPPVLPGFTQTKKYEKNCYYLCKNATDSKLIYVKEVTVTRTSKILSTGLIPDAFDYKLEIKYECSVTLTNDYTWPFAELNGYKDAEITEEEITEVNNSKAEIIGYIDELVKLVSYQDTENMLTDGDPINNYKELKSLIESLTDSKAFMSAVVNDQIISKGIITLRQKVITNFLKTGADSAINDYYDLLNFRMNKIDGTLFNWYTKVVSTDKMVSDITKKAKKFYFFFKSMAVWPAVSDPDGKTIKVKNIDLAKAEEAANWIGKNYSAPSLKVGDTIYILDDNNKETKTKIKSITTETATGEANLDSDGNVVETTETVYIIETNMFLKSCYSTSNNLRVVKQLKS